MSQEDGRIILRREQRPALPAWLEAIADSLRGIEERYQGICARGLPSSMQFCEARIAKLILDAIYVKDLQDKQQKLSLIKEELKGESIQDSVYLKFFKETLPKIEGKS